MRYLKSWRRFTSNARYGIYTLSRFCTTFTSQNHSVGRWLHFCQIEFPQLRTLGDRTRSHLQFYVTHTLNPLFSLVLRASWTADRRESIVRVSTRVCIDQTRVCRWIEGHHNAIKRQLYTSSQNLHQKTRHTLFFFLFLHFYKQNVCQVTHTHVVDIVEIE